VKPTEANKLLKPANCGYIQVCPNCEKIDVYRDDGHSCRDHITALMNRGDES